MYNREIEVIKQIIDYNKQETKKNNINYVLQVVQYYRRCYMDILRLHEKCTIKIKERQGKHCKREWEDTLSGAAARTGIRKQKKIK